jgi:DMSO/TMAO reductase YedYZ molybdopterin-dependent catalytic subunit
MNPARPEPRPQPAAAAPATPGAQSDAVAQMRRMTRRSFASGAAASMLGAGGWAWLRSRPEEGGLPAPLRKMLEFNERVASGYFSAARLAPTFPREAIEPLRINGDVGLGGRFNPRAWKLKVRGVMDPRQLLTLSLDDLRQLPRVEMIIEFKCVEGWSRIMQFAGVRLYDFAVQFKLATRSGEKPDAMRRPDDLCKYVGFITPNRGYYVGYDIAGALHEQTLLCYEMNGEPLTSEHGAPLRLVTAVKYGYKSLKRVGTIVFGDERPADYWAERGYDWYAGH